MANRRNFRRHRGLSEQPESSALESVSIEFTAADTLEEAAAAALNREDIAPSVRADKVARARELIASSDYPPKEVLQSVAGLLAGHLGKDDAS